MSIVCSMVHSTATQEYIVHKTAVVEHAGRQISKADSLFSLEEMHMLKELESAAGKLPQGPPTAS